MVDLDDNVKKEEVAESVVEESGSKEVTNVSATEAKIILSAEELQNKIKEAVEAAEKQSSQKEKQKLYDTIEKLKLDLKEANQNLAKFKQLEEEKRKQEEELKKAMMTDEQRRDEAIKKANLELEQLNLAFEKLKQEMDEKLRLKDLEIYREKLISRANGRIIPELVTGNSIEELDESYRKAVERFNFIKNQVAEELQNRLKHESSL